MSSKFKGVQTTNFLKKIAEDPMDHEVEFLGIILSHNFHVLRPSVHNLLTYLAEKMVFFVKK